jgi:hypothetical protein
MVVAGRGKPGRLAGLLLLAAGAIHLSGCAGLAEGVTRAVMDGPDQGDTRQCYVTGRVFPGLSGFLDRKPGSNNARPTLKVLMVHGIGNPRTAPIVKDRCQWLETRWAVAPVIAGARGALPG